MYVVFKVERRRSFLDCREVYWTGGDTPAGGPAETVKIAKAKPFLIPRAAYVAAGEQGCMSSWQVGDR